MFKDMSKLEKAGLVIGTIECVAGFGLAIYAHCKLRKQANDVENIEDTIPNVEDIMERHLKIIEELEKKND